MTLCTQRCLTAKDPDPRWYLDEISDSGQQVVEGDLGLFEVGLGGAEGHALATPGAGRWVRDGGGGADSTHDPVPDLATAPHVHRVAPPQRHASVSALVLPAERDRR